jgi:hypothetical protein
VPAAVVRPLSATAAWLIALGFAFLMEGGDWTPYGWLCLIVGVLCGLAAVIVHLVARGDEQLARGDEELAQRIDKVADEVEQWAADRQRADLGWGMDRDWDRRQEDFERHQRETKTGWVRLAGRIAPLVDEANRRGYDLADTDLADELDFQMLTMLAGANPTVRKTMALRALADRVRRGQPAEQAPAART